MAYTPITADFAGQDVYIIGGGPSLIDFPWHLLRGKLTVGCNSAYRLGVGVIQHCLFADYSFYRSDKKGLLNYYRSGGTVVSNSEQLALHELDWVRLYPREKWDLSTTRLCFGGNSGCSAASYALLLGAARIYLLGFDCALNGQQRTHWHHWQEHLGGHHDKVLFDKFLKGWRMLSLSLPKVYPGREIINLGPQSALPYFPVQDWMEVLQPQEQLA